MPDSGPRQENVAAAFGCQLNYGAVNITQIPWHATTNSAPGSAGARLTSTCFRDANFISLRHFGWLSDHHQWRTHPH